MEFINRTPFPATFLTGSTGEQEIVGILAAKVTYRLRGGVLDPVTGDDAWPVFDKPFEFRGVSLGPETDFRKQGIDVLVFGEARAPGGKPVTWLRVGVECGGLRHEAVVFGDRVWRRNGSGFVATAPAPFTSMPITNDRAYGGTARLDEAEVGHLVNPEGRGFHYLEDDADGSPLPNLEDEGELIGGWRDEPRPACFFKPAGFLEPRGAPPAPPERVPLMLMRSAFNQTVPELVAEPHEMGDSFHLWGFSEDGDLTFPAPDVTGPTARVKVGELRSRFPSSLSTVVILADERVLIATYLALFRYLVRPMEERRVELTWEDGPDVPPVEEEDGRA